MDVVALVGTIAGVVGACGVPIAYLQLRDSRRSATTAMPGPGLGLAVTREEFGLFAPEARIRGYAHGFLDRAPELQRLAEDVAAHKSVIVIAGVIGAGKTALAARLCRQLAHGHLTRWVFCGEKVQSLSLRSLALSLAFDAGVSSGDRLGAALERGADPSTVIDRVIEVLAAESLLLVLDDFHRVTDSGLHQLVERLEHSEIRSAMILTTSRHEAEPRQVPLVSRLELGGLPPGEARGFLRQRGVDASPEVAASIWRKAGSGNPQALTLFAGQAADRPPEVLAAELPEYTENMEAWIAPLYEELTPGQQAAAKAVAFIYEPAKPDLIRSVAAMDDITAALAALRARFVLTETKAGYEMHGSLRDYLDARLTDDERATYAAKVTAFYQASARQVFLDGLGPDDPSYGLLYLESFPDYFAAEDRHIQFVDDLIDRLTDSGFDLAQGSRILVLGSGAGTHDPGFAKHGFRITDLEIQPEIAELGRANAASLPAEIDYVVADMTRPLPDGAGLLDMDAVFNIGSSFGYEDADADNAAVFRHAASALKPGAPFVFEYVNGPHWENRRVQRQIDVTNLPDGAVRTEYSITNPQAHTSLTSIQLRRPDGTGGWFRHFMHYYRLDEVLAMMRDVGLEPVATYGARGGRVSGEPFDEQASEAMVVIAAKA
ncbi:MAG TPA: AAA family ATPase [Streptosporangiaceae bacterium]|nr:AAA family ATPase [Streptosporangiaceae bacterium]